MGGSRQNSDEEILDWFKMAWSENKLLSLKAAFYNRDIRGGQGERRSFRIFCKWLAQNYPQAISKNLHLIPEYGRWDDLLILENTPVEKEAFALIFKALEEGNKLCAKWMPRENKKGGKITKKLREFAKITPKEYRELLSKNTSVVENLMCKNLWSEINYKSVPSIAQHKYRKAFFRHDEERYKEFLTKVIAGEEKIHASAIFPHDVIKPILEGYLLWSRNKVKLSPKEILNIQAQWQNLPDYFSETKQNILPVCDVSGSMNGLPLEVSVSLGLYCAERNGHLKT